jgi:hypothetical protein
MTENTQKKRRQTLSLILGLIAIGLVTLSIVASADGTAHCKAKVERQINGIEFRTGKQLSRDAVNRLEQKCAEAEVGLALDQLYGNRHQGGDKESRCMNSVKFALESGTEKSGRSEEQLMQVCMALPSTHEASCGFPTSPDEYYVIDNQKCVTKAAGISSKTLAKAEGHQAEKSTSGAEGSLPSADSPIDENSAEEDGNGTSAQ